MVKLSDGAPRLTNALPGLLNLVSNLHTRYDLRPDVVDDELGRRQLRGAAQHHPQRGRRHVRISRSNRFRFILVSLHLPSAAAATYHPPTKGIVFPDYLPAHPGTSSMLHHANVDRLAALWMVVHPNATYQTEAYQTHGLYGTARGDNITAESPLKPFYQADGRTLHTGVTAGELERFGYTYPELQDWEQSRQDEDRECARRDIIARINAVYGYSNGSRGANLAAEAVEEWFLQVAANRSAFELPCTINILVGEKVVGHVPLLAMPKQGLAHAEVPLQRAVQGLGLNTTDRAAVGEALRGQLRVEIKVRHLSIWSSRSVAIRC